MDRVTKSFVNEFIAMNADLGVPLKALMVDKTWQPKKCAASLHTNTCAYWQSKCCEEPGYVPPFK